jgi:hypothetical protein
MPSKGICVYVTENSKSLNYVNVGDSVKLKCYTMDFSKPSEFLETEINHITKDDHERFKGFTSLDFQS